MIYTLKHIETPRLIIRPVQLGDEIALNKAINHSLDILQKWQSWAKDPSMAATRTFIQRGVFAWQSHSIVDFPMVMIHKADQAIIGASGYNDRSAISQGLYEIGYWCDVDYQGQGLVTECANALTRYAFESLAADKVIIQMQINNNKSTAVAERLGFVNEGIKDRDPLDCVSNQTEKNYIYSSNHTNALPSLNVSWEHRTKTNTDAQMIAWAKEALNITDNKAFASSRVILSTPWSTVLEINTGDTLAYLKQTPDLLALEPTIIQVLHDQCQASVPDIIAHNTQLNCFLMKDAGKPLREILKQQFDVALYCKAIHKFTTMQLDTAKHIKIFLDIGVPDWRLDKLPDLYMQLLCQKETLIADGLTENEIGELKTLLPILGTLCQKLSEYGIEQGIVQPDFHDNNILLDEKSRNITLIDLGEIVISHPFFSLTNCLHTLIRHHNLTDKDDAYLQLMDACLNNFTIFGNRQDLLDAWAITSKIAYVYHALGYHLLILACDRSKLASFYGHGRLCKPLREFMTVCRQMHDQ